MEHKQLADWLEKKFVEWEALSGRRRTIAEFAEWLSIPRPLLSRYMSGSRKPKRETADLIAAKLGPEVYDLLGFQRPDPLLQRLQACWDDLNDEQRNQIRQFVETVESQKLVK